MYEINNGLDSVGWTEKVVKHIFKKIGMFSEISILISIIVYFNKTWLY